MKGKKMVKGLFTSLEEVKFQNDYVRGNVEKFRDPNVQRNPAETSICIKKRNTRPHVFLGRTR